jgi:hypothetical protein
MHIVWECSRITGIPIEHEIFIGNGLHDLYRFGSRASVTSHLVLQQKNQVVLSHFSAASVSLRLISGAKASGLPIAKSRSSEYGPYRTWLALRSSSLWVLRFFGAAAGISNRDMGRWRCLILARSLFQVEFPWIIAKRRDTFSYTAFTGAYWES